MIIPESVRHPVVYKEQQQIVIASLNILPGGILTITDALKGLVVLGDVTIFGTLEIAADAQTVIITGGSWTVMPGGQSDLGFGKKNVMTGVDRGFLPASSTVHFTGSGRFGATSITSSWIVL